MRRTPSIIKTVYSYLFPEVRLITESVAKSINQNFYSLVASIETQEELSKKFIPPLLLPTTRSWGIDLDAIHEPILERVRAVYATRLNGLNSLPYSYPTAGSSEGLMHMLVYLKSQGIHDINILTGEYEGYAAYAAAVGIKTHPIDLAQQDINTLTPGVWFISNPSARDGNWISDSLVKELGDRGHRMILDVAYLGATAPRVMNIEHPLVMAVLASLSKPYGMFRYRVGYLFTKQPIDSLYGNRWFKDPVRHLQGLAVLEQLGFDTLYKKYRPLQENIVRKLRENLNVPIVSSDALLLAHLPREEVIKNKVTELLPLIRHDTCRICLTEFFEAAESSIDGLCKSAA